MESGYASPLVDRLRQAEEAETQVHQLESLASQAPHLRAEVAKAHRQEERDRNRQNAMSRAQKEIVAAAEKQAEVPAALETVAKMVYALYSYFKEIEAHRKDAYQCLAIVDRMDYEEELEAGSEEQKELGRDPKSIEYLVASRHGPNRVKQLLHELDTDFSFLKGCDVDEPLRRDVANFILAHVVSPERAASQGKTPAPTRAGQPAQ